MIRRILLTLLVSLAVRAEDLPPGREVLAFARAHLPSEPVRLTGSLKERAPNGFVKKELTVEMDLHWGGEPANAVYRIRNEKTSVFQTLEIRWFPGGPEFQYSENGADQTNFNPHSEIDGLGITWADLSFSFLWHPGAQTEGAGKKLGRDCWIVAVPRGGNRLRLWIQEETGQVLGAKEQNPEGKTVKEIKVVSVKEFNGLWMVKDLDIIQPLDNRRTSLRIDSVELITQN
ncbi:MAG: hypothetical protein AB7E95_05295 [Kiritimatiellales bacterium]